MVIPIKVKCSFCHGEGKRWVGKSVNSPGEYVDCTECNATGLLDDAGLDETHDDAVLSVLDDIVDKVNDLKEKCDEIKEVCDNIWDKVK